MTNVVKFPYIASRRVHSRKPRVSKNGTPEERAAKTVTAAAELTSATIADISSRSGVVTTSDWPGPRRMLLRSSSSCIN